MAYRTAKFIRRNRPAVTLALLAIIATVVGLVGTFLQARTAHAQRDFALRQLLRAEAVNEFNEFLLSDAAPSGKPFTVEDLLGRAERVLAKQHAPDDNDRVELLVSIGDQYSTQDEDAKARRVLEQAYSISRTLPTKSVRAQASCALAGALARDGDLIRAETLFRDGLREVSAEPQYALDRIFCLRRGSEVAQQRGDSREGIARIEQAHTILRASPFDSDVPELHVLIELAEAYRMAGRNQQAVPAFEAAAKLLSSLGRDNTQTEVALLNGWALALDRVGRPREAEKLFLRAIGISRAGGKDDFVSPLLLNNYAKTLLQLSRLNDAACYAERAYAKAWQVDNQLAISQSLYVRALIYLDQPDVTRAAAMLAELEPRLRRSLPADSYWFGALASAQSMLAQDRGDLQTASELAGRALAITEASVKAGGQGMDFLPALLLRQVVISLKIGRHDEATALASRALKLLQAETRAGAFSAWIGRAYLTLGRALQLEGKEEDARAAFQAAAEHLQNTLGPDHPDTRSARRLCVRLRSTEKA